MRHTKYFKKSAYFLTVVLLSLCFAGKAQLNSASNSNGILPNIIPPSPEAGALGRFGAWPVSQYTGVPNISIPLYNIKVGNFTLPIQLSYHAGGVKIDDVSSSVGTGWALNAGGAITRTIVGLQDDGLNGLIDQHRMGVHVKSSYDLTGLVNKDDYVFLRKVLDQQIDVEPDVYYFNFAGMSGRFYFDSVGVFHSVPANNLKIIRSPIQDALAGSPASDLWIIADQTGNTYFFGSNVQDAMFVAGNGIEQTAIGKPPYQPQTTAWYMTQIVLANRADTIRFEYTAKSETYYLPRTQSFRYLEFQPTTPPAQGNGTWPSVAKANQILFNGDNVPPVPFARFLTTGNSSLSRITWREGEIDMRSNTIRQDMLNSSGKMLDSIYVYDWKGIKLRSFGFNYSYVGQRYYLDSLIGSGQNGVSPQKYSFEYIQRQILPASEFLSNSNSSSYAQDHWGYCNGTGNPSLLPPSTKMPSIVSTYLTANRQPDNERMQYGSLQKITYPTGGFTIFQYEANRYDPTGFSGDDNPTPPVVDTVTHLSGSSTPPYAHSLSFTAPVTHNATVHISYHDYGHPSTKSFTWFPYVKIEQQTASGYTQVYYGDAFDNYPATSPPPNANGLYDYDYTSGPFLLTQGATYRVTVSDSCIKFGCDELATIPWANIDLTYSVYQTPPPGQPAPLPLAGGLRINTITNYTNAGTFADAKKYAYSPGKLLTYPSYVHKYGRDVSQLMAGANCAAQFLIIREETSSSQTILGFTQGSTVGYQQVKETEVAGDGTDKGYISYNFSYTPDSLNELTFDLSYQFWQDFNILNPSIPGNNFDYKRGLLESKSTYKKNSNGTYTLLDSLSNSYNFNDFNPSKRYNRLRTIRIKQLRFVNYPCGIPYGGYILPVGLDPNNPNDSVRQVSAGPDIGYSFYDVISSWVQHVVAKETLYDQNGANPLVTITNYYYDNAAHMNPTRIETQKSNGKMITSLTSYPQDYAAGTPFIDSMVAHYLIGVPIENVKYQVGGPGDTTILSGTVSVFKPDGKGLLDQTNILKTSAPTGLNNFKFSNVASAGKFPFNSTKSAFTPDGNYEGRLTVDSYDSYANMLELHKSNDAHRSYIWDYKAALPIAEVFNAVSSEVGYTSFEADGTGGIYLANNGVGILTTDGITGKNCYAINNSLAKFNLDPSKTYIVSLWAKNGTPSNNGFNGSTQVIGDNTSWTTGKTVNGWTYLERKFTGVTKINIGGGGGLVDEVRVYPANAQMTTYTYQPLTGMTSQCDAAGRITYYEYDGLQRLLRIRDMDGNIVRQFQYKYQTAYNQ